MTALHLVFPRLYLGLDLAVTLIGLFALVEIIGKRQS